MDAGSSPERLPRYVPLGVQLLSVLIAAVELGRTAFGNDGDRVIYAAVCVALFLPLHAQHLRYGLRGLRPPRAGLTLGICVAVHAAALVLVGQGWTFMLATLATSGFIVLGRGWAIALFLACCAAVVPTAGHHCGEIAFGNTQYLVYSVAFRTLIQVAFVGLVAAAQQLAVTRAALAAELVAEERMRLEGEVRGAVERRLDRVVELARRARRGLAGPDVAGPLLALDHMLELSREALADLRRIVSSPHVPEPHGASEGPVGDALARRRAVRLCVLVQLVVVPFPLLQVLGTFQPGTGDATPFPLIAWIVLAGVELAFAVSVARGRIGPRWTAPAWALTTGLSVVAMLWLGTTWETTAWLFGVASLNLFRGWTRVLPAVVIGAVPVIDTIHTPFPSNGIGLLGPVSGTAWVMSYSLCIDVLAIGGLYVAARLVAIVGELETTRAALAAQAAEAERRRLSSDLHDVLGQSLTALSLKGELARRLVRSDRDRATAELDGLLELATGQAAELDAVTRGERRVDAEIEAREATRLLAAAGAEVQVELALHDPSPDVRAVLGWAIREGATNVVRHARPRHVRLQVTADAHHATLTLRNDGAPPWANAGGTGLRNLRERVAATDGSFAAGPGDEPGEWVLEVRLGALVTA